MNREFQVIYREMRAPDFTEPASGLQTLNVIFHDAYEIQAAFDKDPSLRILSIKEIRPVVDWDKPTWDRDEFAAAMSIKGGTLSSKKGDGKIPWSSTVGGVPRRVAMRWIENSLNEAGRKILEELRSE